MRHRLFGSLFLLAGATLVACGGNAFEAGSQGVTGDDGGSSLTDAGLDASITHVVGPPTTDGAPLDDAADDGATAVADGSGDATLQGEPDASTDSGTPDAGQTCAADQKLCGGKCVLTNPSVGCAATSCTPCSLPNATATCDTGGACAVETCSAGYEHCTGAASGGCETSISTSSNCGSCGQVCGTAAPDCAASGSTWACTNGCPAGDALCGTACVNTSTSTADCGGCTTSTKSYACAAPTNGTATCSAGACGFTCTSGFSECDSDKCVSLTTDPSNCGTCNTACPVPANGTATCAPVTGIGVCGIECNTPYSACNSTCINEQTSVADCGGCSTSAKSYACPTPANSTASCSAGACGFTCDSGYQLCNGACVQVDPTAAFVSASTVTTGCGSIGAPCGTIAAGMAYAASLGKTHIYVASGTYNEQVILTNGLTLEGGWLYGGGSTWTKACTAGIDASALSIIAPTSQSMAVVAKAVTATLTTISIHNNATAAAGESLYGLFAASTDAANPTSITLNAVEVTVAAGGAGAAGGVATAPALPASNVAPCAIGAGNAGATVSAGAASLSTYGVTGFTVGTGTTGQTGNPGANGAAGAAGVCVNDAYCGSDGCDSSQACSGQGGNGCGGSAGPAGLGGQGGGASIAVYDWLATVQINAGSLGAGNGGPGGAGGGTGSAASQLAPATAPTTGTPGLHGLATSCKGGAVGACTSGATTPVLGGAGSTGGAGSPGGAGGAGAGGDSYAYYLGGGGTVTASGTPALTFGTAGTSPAGTTYNGHAAAHN